jgi:hypothetical protein
LVPFLIGVVDILLIPDPKIILKSMIQNILFGLNENQFNHWIANKYLSSLEFQFPDSLSLKDKRGRSFLSYLCGCDSETGLIKPIILQHNFEPTIPLQTVSKTLNLEAKNKIDHYSNCFNLNFKIGDFEFHSLNNETEGDFLSPTCYSVIYKNGIVFFFSTLLTTRHLKNILNTRSIIPSKKESNTIRYNLAHELNLQEKIQIVSNDKEILNAFYNVKNQKRLMKTKYKLTAQQQFYIHNLLNIKSSKRNKDEANSLLTGEQLNNLDRKILKGVDYDVPKDYKKILSFHNDFSRSEICSLIFDYIDDLIYLIYESKCFLIDTSCFYDLFESNMNFIKIQSIDEEELCIFKYNFYNQRYILGSPAVLYEEFKAINISPGVWVEKLKCQYFDSQNRCNLKNKQRFYNDLKIIFKDGFEELGKNLKLDIRCSRKWSLPSTKLIIAHSYLKKNKNVNMVDILMEKRNFQEAKEKEGEGKKKEVENTAMIRADALVVFKRMPLGSTLVDKDFLISKIDENCFVPSGILDIPKPFINLIKFREFDVTKELTDKIKKGIETGMKEEYDKYDISLLNKSFNESILKASFLTSEHKNMATIMLQNNCLSQESWPQMENGFYDFYTHYDDFFRDYRCDTKVRQQRAEIKFINLIEVYDNYWPRDNIKSLSKEKALELVFNKSQECDGVNVDGLVNHHLGNNHVITLLHPVIKTLKDLKIYEKDINDYIIEKITEINGIAELNIAKRSKIISGDIVKQTKKRNHAFKKENNLLAKEIEKLRKLQQDIITGGHRFDKNSMIFTIMNYFKNLNRRKEVKIDGELAFNQGYEKVSENQIYADLTKFFTIKAKNKNSVFRDKGRIKPKRRFGKSIKSKNFKIACELFINPAQEVNIFGIHISAKDLCLICVKTMIEVLSAEKDSTEMPGIFVQTEQLLQLRKLQLETMNDIKMYKNLCCKLSYFELGFRDRIDEKQGKAWDKQQIPINREAIITIGKVVMNRNIENRKKLEKMLEKHKKELCRKDGVDYQRKVPQFLYHLKNTGLKLGVLKRIIQYIIAEIK